MSTSITERQLEAIDVATVGKTYYGGAGCACGCQGTYSEFPVTVRNRVASVNEAILGKHEYVTRWEFPGGSEVIIEWVRPDGKVHRLYIAKEI